MTEKVSFYEAQVQIQAGNVATVYCNGSIVNVGVADISALFLLDTTQVIKLHLSYTSAKNLQVALAKAVALLEEATRHNIMVSEEVEAGLRAKAGETKTNV